MITKSPHFRMDVERGPDWLFVMLHRADDDGVDPSSSTIDLTGDGMVDLDGPAEAHVSVSPPEGETRIFAVREREADEYGLADYLCEMLDRSFTHRMLVELDDLSVVHSPVWGQLVELRKRIAQRGGMLRISGASPPNREALHATRLDSVLAHYENRTDAVMSRSGIMRRGSGKAEPVGASRRKPR